MHPIKKQILFQLSISSALPFSKLKPKQIESNLFMYHLKQLISDEIIQKNDQGLYELTLDGYILMSKTSRVNFRVREQPLIFNMIICQNSKGQYLLYKRLRQPFLGQISFPYGKLHLGEKIQPAAHRELEEKTGLKGDLEFLGSVYKIIYQQDQLLTHTLVHIFKATNIQGQLITKGPLWECFWDKITKPEDKKYNPGTADVLKLYQSSSTPFFEEFTYHI